MSSLVQSLAWIWLGIPLCCSVGPASMIAYACTSSIAKPSWESICQLHWTSPFRFFFLGPAHWTIPFDQCLQMVKKGILAVAFEIQSLFASTNNSSPNFPVLGVEGVCSEKATAHVFKKVIYNIKTKTEMSIRLVDPARLKKLLWILKSTFYIAFHFDYEL